MSPSVNNENIEDIPVLIVGGGGCGLSLSAFLADYGIDHVLCERHQSTSILPKAHYLNQRTMETFRLHAMIDDILAASCPTKNMSLIGWATSLGGDGPLDRKMIHQDSCFGGDEGTERVQPYLRDAPLRSANVPQLRLEPILRKYASAKNPGRVLFGHEVVDLADEDEHVLVTVRTDNGTSIQYRAQYVVGADGGRWVGPRIGAEMQGPTGLCDMVSVHFESDLSEYWDDRFFACHLVNGNCATIFESGAIVPMGPTWGKHSEEWVFHMGFDLADEDRFDESKIIPRMRQLLNISDLQIKIRKISHWVIERVVSNKYRQNRIFLAGDAAHRRPPTTGLGLNTSIEDALNLAWKLAMVVKGQATAQLLDTYELERRPVGERNADWGLFTFQNSSVINAALGLMPGKKRENQKQFERLFEESERGETMRAQVRYMVESQRIEFGAHGIELGFRYEQGCLIPDDSAAPWVDPLGQQYTPSTRPGCRLPHVWLQGDNYEVSTHGPKIVPTLSTHDIVEGLVAWGVITDEDGDEWVSAAARVSAKWDVKINTLKIGELPLWKDYDGQWPRVKGFGQGGAILVRPDNMVAWRSSGPSQCNGEELDQAMKTLLYGAGRLAESVPVVNGSKS